jgi:hypothetical protein
LTIEQLGSVGEFIAAIATIATLAYLALQIRQSNRSHQLSAIARIAEGTETWIGQVVQSPELHDLYQLGMREPEKMTKEQQGRFELLVMQMLRSTESAWLQVRWGLVDDDYWHGYRETLRLIAGSEAGRRAFARNRNLLAPSFASEVEKILGDPQGVGDEPRSSAPATTAA